MDSLIGLSNLWSFALEAGNQERIFGLDAQLVADVCIQGISIFILFAFLSYILFEPVKKVLEARQQRIKSDIESAKTDKEEAAKLKAEYDAKIKDVEKEAEEILSEARKKALKKENDIVEAANQEANRIMARANQEIELEKSKMADEMKQQMIQVATVMAEKIVAVSLSEAQQDALLEETLKEMGEKTWQSL